MAERYWGKEDQYAQHDIPFADLEKQFEYLKEHDESADHCQKPARREVKPRFLGGHDVDGIRAFAAGQ